MYQQLSKHSVIVQKYGGTSVESIEKIHKIAKRIAEQYQSGMRRLVVVVSAMGKETNRLVSLTESLNQPIDSASYDLVVSAGEQVSAGLMAAALKQECIPAQPFLAHQLAICTDRLHGAAQINSIDINKIHACWQQGKIPVVAGFQGVNDLGELTTLGRGGSDTTAATLAAFLNADLCEINTDVEGVYSADPNRVKGAQLLKVLDYEVAREMAVLGSRVLHPRCVEISAQYNIPIVVRDTFSKDHRDYTLVHSGVESRCKNNAQVTSLSVDKKVARVLLTAITSKQMAEVFDCLAQAAVNVDVIVHERVEEEDKAQVSFSVSTVDQLKTLAILEKIKLSINSEQHGEKSFDFTIEHELAKVSVIGSGLLAQSQITAQLLQILEYANIDVYMMSSSEIKISCMVLKKEATLACQLLHDHLIQQPVTEPVLAATAS
ncbi:aspartate kinase [Piscirickettsia salmonis]|uniref:Aspartokinase n=2 Tax=Piscirickettsia salmonis TaxID=1238 RepID=A0A9Q6PT28_PISSA|nr:aspartate kinase [Piscirickettsia salmonis]ALA25721.1 aspartate kinase domain protein [Piscirickettsia salmonis]APS43210.1 aspartate kinase [Piscirickettsia salmonis]APS46559.1 aspartate kinase [Piscirickettsia salmonis]APS53731.1 aspartate kinase [Piscirickettsia salmonis]APS56799.1 aspartate kinase [Piscirickettsia salmonis]